jgi:hypothetical protein
LRESTTPAVVGTGERAGNGLDGGDRTLPALLVLRLRAFFGPALDDRFVGVCVACTAATRARLAAVPCSRRDVDADGAEGGDFITAGVEWRGRRSVGVGDLRTGVGVAPRLERGRILAKLLAVGLEGLPLLPALPRDPELPPVRWETTGGPVRCCGSGRGWSEGPVCEVLSFGMDTLGLSARGGAGDTEPRALLDRGGGAGDTEPGGLTGRGRGLPWRSLSSWFLGSLGSLWSFRWSLACAFGAVWFSFGASFSLRTLGRTFTGVALALSFSLLFAGTGSGTGFGSGSGTAITTGSMRGAGTSSASVGSVGWEGGWEGEGVSSVPFSAQPLARRPELELGRRGVASRVAAIWKRDTREATWG